MITIFHIDTWNNANTTSRVLPVVSYFENGSFQIDKYQHLTPDKAKIGEHYYSDKAPLPTLMVIPVFGLLKFLGIIKDIGGSYYGKHVYVIGAIICSIIPFVLILCFTFLIQIRKKTNSPALMSSLPFYASFIFIYAGTFYNHILSAFFILLGYIFVKDKKYIYAGIFSGLAFLCEYVVAIFILVWAIQILWNEKKIKSSILFALGVIPSLIFILIYNYHFTGSAITMIYKFSDFTQMNINYGFNFPSVNSVFGILFSSYKGLFVYTPILIIILFLFLQKILKSSFVDFLSLLASNYILVSSFFVVLLISSYFLWWGGWSFGPRLLLFVAVLLLYEGLPLIKNNSLHKIAFWLLIFVGLIITFSAKITLIYSVPSEVKFPWTDIILVMIKSMDFNNGNILTYFFGIKPLIANALWLLLFPICIFLLSKLEIYDNGIKTSKSK